MNATSEATIEAVADLPLIRIVREFDATPEQVQRAHTDPALFARWIGPNSRETHIEVWDARTGGEWRYTNTNCEGDAQVFHGCFHQVRPGRMVQTFTWGGMPDGVSLDTVTFEELPGGRTRLVGTSLVDSLEGRDAILRSGMDVGLREGYAKLDALLESGV
ncbi:MAG: SRPBCC family protein [Marmoricola sp.]